MMIISASRRTDLPCYYSEWFFNRLREGFVLVRNPRNAHQISRVSLSPDVVDGIVFWTKNAAPMLGRLAELKDYPYYFQYTVTPYGKEIEPGVPEKEEALRTFQRLADLIGPERVIWRYDPVLIFEKYTVEAHIAHFAYFAHRLKGSTRKCIFSFIDRYKNTERNQKTLGACEVSVPDQLRIARAFSEIAHGCGIALETCSEQIDFGQFGIRHARCVDDRLFAKLCGCPLDSEKDKNQRPACGCAASIDIGMYNTCRNGCLYCYANYNPSMVKKNSSARNPSSLLLSGNLEENDRVRERKTVSLKNGQICFFGKETR